MEKKEKEPTPSQMMMAIKLCIFLNRKMMLQDNAGLLEANEALPLTVVQIDDTLAVETCQRHKYKYVIISPDDIVIPPKDYDNIQDNTVA